MHGVDNTLELVIREVADHERVALRGLAGVGVFTTGWSKVATLCPIERFENGGRQRALGTHQGNRHQIIAPVDCRAGFITLDNRDAA